jgi:hypothetical protein
MSVVQPPPDAADEDPVLDEKGRVIDLPTGALSSSTRRPRPRGGRSTRSPRSTAGVDLGAALDASLADVTAAAERLADRGGVTPAPPAGRSASRPAGPRPASARPVSERPAPERPAPERAAPERAAPSRPASRARAVPRPPAWQPVPWAEAARSAEPTPVPAPAAPRPQAPRPQASPPAASRTAITLPFPLHHSVEDEPEARLHGLERGPEPARTVPGWLLSLMVVVVAAIACLAAYLLLRP